MSIISVAGKTPGRLAGRHALVAVSLSTLLFFLCVPFATRLLPEVPAFIPVYEFALLTCDLITAILLLRQFGKKRSPGLFVLALGYLFTASVTFTHALTFPGVFSATGLLGAGAQSTAWLYMFWHGGFPLFVILYALLKGKGPAADPFGDEVVLPRRSTRAPVFAGIVAVLIIDCGLTYVATVHNDAMPVLIVNKVFTSAMKNTVAGVWLLSFAALAVLLWKRPHSALDMWLTMVICAWIFEIGLSAVFNAARFDLGWYAGRVYGLIAASSLFLVLLTESGTRFGTRSRAVFVTGLLALVLAGGLQTFVSLRTFLDLNAWVDHTRDVLVTSGQLRMRLTEAEDAQRGYLIAPNESFLRSYRKAVSGVPSNLKRLQLLTADNAMQQQHVAELTISIDQRLARMQEMLGLRTSGESMSSENMQVGADLMAEIDRTMSEINEEERQLYAVRLQALEQSAQQAISLTAALIAAGVLIIAWLGMAMLHESRRREASDLALKQLNFELERRVEIRAGELKHANELVNAIVDSSPLAIISLDQDRKIVTWSRGAAALLGYSQDEALGLDLAVLGGDNGGDLLTEIYRLAAGGTSVQETVSRPNRDGKPVDIQAFVAPLLESSGLLRGSVIIIEDVTERSAIETQLRHAQKMEAVGQLTGGLAHDFNNLLAVIIGNLDYAGEKLAADAEARMYLDRAQSAALRGAELNRQLLAFARRQPLRAERVDINALAGEMIKLQSRTLGAAIEIKTDLAEDVSPVLADPSQIGSALLNLCINARDAMAKGGRLTIATANRRIDEDYVSIYPDAKVGDYVMLSVQDTGAGMSPEVCARAFDPFFTTKGVGKGSGLGLSMVYGFAKQSGGHASVYSELGTGTVVRLYLPRAPAVEAEVVARDLGTVQKASIDHLILAVDDDRDVRRLVVQQLTDFGYRVLEANDGPDALDKMQHSGPVGLLFTDVIMPGGMSGVDLVRAARKIQPGLRVLFTSGFPDMASNAEIEELGDLVISKPYLRKDLAIMVQKVFDSQNGASP